MTTETELVEVRGKTYSIKRFGFQEGVVVDEQVEQAKGNLMKQQATIVFYGTIEPKFESIESVLNEDRETVLHLWFAINKFNQFETAFLSQLKNSPSPESPQNPTNPS